MDSWSAGNIYGPYKFDADSLLICQRKDEAFTNAPAVKCRKGREGGVAQGLTLQFDQGDVTVLFWVCSSVRISDSLGYRTA